MAKVEDLAKRMSRRTPGPFLSIVPLMQTRQETPTGKEYKRMQGYTIKRTHETGVQKLTASTWIMFKLFKSTTAISRPEYTTTTTTAQPSMLDIGHSIPYMQLNSNWQVFKSNR
ncbi:hypothetical protein KC19_5G142400 [Ceratodon purpureus]|uniref:Uncharacterized protein n=1 Tax=Ceratodon purpureus TaxID=3225 RepID=A0A8T0I2S7_CERPU|nr:hypothetical protein KC19_5G142400 [Ceratodon purpureus]